jgi:hypothetical protein
MSASFPDGPPTLLRPAVPLCRLPSLLCPSLASPSWKR